MTVEDLRAKQLAEDARALVGAVGAERRFKKACNELWRAGNYPSPTTINYYLGRGGARAKINDLNGREVRWRREWARCHPDCPVRP